VPDGPNSQLFRIHSRGDGHGRVIVLPEVDQHLIQHQERCTGGHDDEENPSNENCRTIATRPCTLRTVRGQLGFEQLQELFWCCLVGFDFVHGVHLRLMFGANPKERAYLAPFLAFLLLLALGGAVKHFGDGRAFWVFSEPRYWVFPLQTVLCTVLLVRGWPRYGMQAPRRPLFTIGIGVLALLLWIAPQEWLGAPRRMDGFNPEFFGATGWFYAAHLGLRLLCLVVVIPLLEEIFWRGFLLRYLIDEDFTRVPMGTFSWRSFAIVTAGFCLEHRPPDWPAAILTGALYNLVAYRTRSLSSCVLVHAVTNALLGAYVLHSRQWGFW